MFLSKGAASRRTPDVVAAAPPGHFPEKETPPEPLFNKISDDWHAHWG